MNKESLLSLVGLSYGLTDRLIEKTFEIIFLLGHDKRVVYKQSKFNHYTYSSIL
jgi:hypothetical protein